MNSVRLILSSKKNCVIPLGTKIRPHRFELLWRIIHTSQVQNHSNFFDAELCFLFCVKFVPDLCGQRLETSSLTLT